MSAQAGATASSRSSARPTSPTTPQATIAQALDLWRRLDLPNVLIKVPATAAGVGAIEELTAARRQRQRHAALLR